MDDLDEKVLDIQQRQKRAQIMRRYKTKIERAREIAKKRMAPEANIRKRAYAQARQIVRRRVAGARGAEYEKLGPSEKIAIDRAVEGKQKAIKKLALRLIPRVKQAESKRLHAFMHGQQIQNQGQPEGNSKESSGSSSVKEELNFLFTEAFPQMDTSNALGQKVDNPLASSDKKMPPKGKSKNPVIVQYNKFNEEVENDTSAFASLFNKSEKSGIDLEVLGEVYNRGWNVWTEDCKVTQQQYAFARVNSFINQGKTYFNEDADLHEGLDKNHPIVKEYNALKKHDIKSLRSMIAQKGGVVDTSGFKSKDQAASHLIRTKHGNKKVDQAFGFNEDVNEAREPGRAYVAPFNDEQGNQRGWKSSNKWGKVKYWQPHAKKSALKHAGLQEEETQIDEISQETKDRYIKRASSEQGHANFAKRQTTDPEEKKHFSDVERKRRAGLNKAFGEEVSHTNENFIDKKGPGKPGDAARHGLKGKSASELKKIRSSETASPRQKQLAHWMLNMHHNEETELDEAVEKVTGTNCRNCTWWKPDSEKPVTKEELNKNGGLKAPNKEYIAMSKRIDLGTLPGEDHSVKVKGFCEHDEINDWVTERMCCSQWDADGMIRDYKGHSPVMKEEGESILPQTTSPGSKIRKKIEVVDRKPPHQPLTRQAEIERKIIEDHNNCGTPECCGQCDTAVTEKLGNSQSDPKKRLIGTDSLVKAYKTDTPGQCNESLNENFNIAFASGVGVTLTSADLGMKVQGGFSLHPSVIEQMAEMEEEVRSADIKGVIVRTASGKAIVRRQKVDRKIIGTGNLTDGKPDDTV